MQEALVYIIRRYCAPSNLYLILLYHIKTDIFYYNFAPKTLILCGSWDFFKKTLKNIDTPIDIGIPICYNKTKIRDNHRH